MDQWASERSGRPICIPPCFSSRSQMLHFYVLASDAGSFPHWTLFCFWGGGGGGGRGVEQATEGWVTPSNCSRLSFPLRLSFLWNIPAAHLRSVVVGQTVAGRGSGLWVRDDCAISDAVVTMCVVSAWRLTAMCGPLWPAPDPAGGGDRCRCLRCKFRSITGSPRRRWASWGLGHHCAYCPVWAASACAARSVRSVVQWSAHAAVGAGLNKRWVLSVVFVNMLL